MIRQNRRIVQNPWKVCKKNAPESQDLMKLRVVVCPQGRPTLVCGSAGAGKTLFAMEFLVRGATLFNEPGVFMSFEETDEELTKNVASLGFDLRQLDRRQKTVA